MAIQAVLKQLTKNCFNPVKDIETSIPDRAGVYLFCLKKKSTLPSTNVVPIFKTFNGVKVIYAGKAGTSLFKRDYKQHFKSGNAGKSTLRKSLGVLFGYPQIYRDNSPNNSKTKFKPSDEKKISQWMHENLLMYYYPTDEFNKIELELINHFQPPLNIEFNKISINSDFIAHLKQLRNTKKLTPKAVVTNDTQKRVRNKIKLLEEKVSKTPHPQKNIADKFNGCVFKGLLIVVIIIILTLYFI